MNLRLLTRVFCTILLTLGILFIHNEVACQVRVTRIASSQVLSGKKGIVYTLPRSVIDIEVVVTRTLQFPGPLAEYAGEFLGTSDVVTKNKEEYHLDKAVMTCRAEPDPGQIYIIEKEDKSQGEIWISFGRDGHDMAIENFIKEAGPAGFSKWDDNLFETQDAEGLFKRYSASATRELIDTIVRKVSVDTLTIEETVLKRSLVPYPDRDKAQEAADRINRIDSDVYNLLIGYQETAYPRDALEFMYDKLMQERNDYVALFTGVTVKESLSIHYSVVPDPSKLLQEYPVTGFSSTSGLVAPDGQNAITLVLTAADSAVVSDASIGTLPKGIVYRVPYMMPVKLEYKGMEMASANYELMQFGSLLALPAEFKKVELDLSTGKVRSVVIE